MEQAGVIPKVGDMERIVLTLKVPRHLPYVIPSEVHMIQDTLQRIIWSMIQENTGHRAVGQSVVFLKVEIMGQIVLTPKVLQLPPNEILAPATIDWQP